MAQIKLTTKAAVERLPAPDPSGKQMLHLDTEIAGFGVLCSGTTATKSYIVQKRLPNKMLRRVTIGSVAHMDLKDAQKRARELFVSMGQGVDPNAEKQRQRVSTLRTTLRTYLESRTLAPKTIKGYENSVNNYLAAWTETPLAGITPDMVRAKHKEIGAAHGEATANLTFRTLRLLYNFAMERDSTLPANPVRLKKVWFKNVVRDTFVRPEQLPAFYKAVDQLPNRIAADYLKLLLLTGLRREEAAGLKWEECDLDARVIRLPADRTKAKRKFDLPMSSYVHDLLDALRKDRKQGPFVFPASSKSGHIAEPRHPLGLVREVSGVEIHKIHDLRRTYVTVAESCDISPLALKALVNHALPGDVTSGYVQMTVERLRAPAQGVADRMMELCQAKA